MSRVAELTLKLLDGSLGAGEGAELDALVGHAPGAGGEHLRLLELEAELRGLYADFDLAEATLAAIGAAQAARTAGAVLAAIGERPPPAWAARAEPQHRSGRRSRRRVAWAAGCALAAAVLVAVWVGPEPVGFPVPFEGGPGAPVPHAFAKLSRKAGFVEVLNAAGDLVPAEEGSELPAGFTLRTGADDSRAVVDVLSDNSRFEIESDTVVRFRDGAPEGASKPQLFLAAGQLTAAIPHRPEGRPVVVGTAVTDVFARGGLFVVSSVGPDTARVDIKHGKVELVRTAVPKPVPVGVGSALVTAGLERVHIERSQVVDRVAVRTLAFPGARDAVYAPDGSEIWVANARAFTRWGALGTTDLSFYARRTEGAAAFSRDARFLMTFRGDKDDRVLVRTLPDGGEHAALNLRLNETRFWAAAPDASWVAAADPKPARCVRLVDSSTGDERFRIDFDENVGCVAADPSGQVLAVGLNDPARGLNNKVLLLDAATGVRLASLPMPRKPLTGMAYARDARLLAVGFNGTVQLWNVRTRELVRSITGFERPLTCFAFSADGQRLAGGAADGTVWVWDVATGRQTQLIESGGRGVRAVVFAPDGTQLVTVANGAPVAVWAVNPTVPAATELQ